MILIDKMDHTIKRLKSQAANTLTIGNMVFGGASLMATLNEYYSYSVLFIFIAAFLDRFDGMVARKYNQESELGKQLDSMGDIISFGVAPALLIHQLALQDFGLAGMVFTVIYISCGAFRLARFNITESNGYFTGLPITAAGTVLTLSYFGFSHWSPAVYMFILLISSLLMISTFSLRKV
ncbi:MULTISPECIES: CDP-diacylglycerol--serine O-phosphatidyltransferase [unclassified Planococcus (in: firmicutes)]|uniref:CDP-diacylglycerol--serine O-phosphatidyltransferase n=2 Tax=Caryophanaceae TaxID=186818 RepID=UPI000C3384BD|nr:MULTISPECIES: CDP-diacylglycerol--serine O-phosphatidyltransferase [unclassified Planococcus (in: firmicutes)]AUD13719.1 CDP-diacylglycerol--serine O-phosphatidyltransferase [Planococcus sp. MB-3u-03]PKG45808.1 CDP-diacylglycerol--serine O-phosphatidyltransferase [Planococcus sp. Urea-trap-24]PKG88483.1 CDP-diacylglycerol--serine O-phosphatidyltransferase [Planococcus sp. Urea-3u-39]PKH38799.1 CDP-diacylglycerol--serine O-phosphatidyltransferase [Planococcus sp. MB-3u-09]